MKLQSQLGATPVTTLSVPFDLIIGPKTDPVRQWAILPLLLGQRSLGSERLLRRLNNEEKENDL